MRALLLNVDRDLRAERDWARLLVEFRVHAARDPAVNERYARAHAVTVRRLADVFDRIHERASVVPTVPTRTMAEFVLAIGSGATLERLADPAALGDGLIEMAVGGFGLRPRAGSTAPTRRGRERR